MAYTLLHNKKILDVVKYRWLCFLISAILIIPGVIAMFWSVANNPTPTPLLVGIDFTGGTIIQYAVNKDVNTDEVGVIRKNLLDNGVDNPIIQVLKSPSIEGKEASQIGTILSIRTRFSEEGQNESIDQVSSIIRQDYPDANIVQVTSVGPVLGKQLFVNSLISVCLALIGIIMYLTIRFQLNYAIMAVVALIHDVLFILGSFSLLGIFYGVHIDSLFVTAILTVIGFSVHDTIVVYDRIRENLKFLAKKLSYDEIINASVNQTLARSVNTSVTTLLTLCALYFFGGVTTKDFVLVMILGIAVGTYSSIFVASTLLGWLNDIKEAKEKKKVTA